MTNRTLRVVAEEPAGSQFKMQLTEQNGHDKNMPILNQDNISSPESRGRSSLKDKVPTTKSRKYVNNKKLSQFKYSQLSIVEGQENSP